ncbi:hypothetical protein ABZ686_08740 [Streptomyces sp. NPDC006992]|uniref:hypothetical protein n=1 Tax=unclassified Streptomyces TaxID=2593676 RepID=UPI0033E6AAB3
MSPAPRPASELLSDPADLRLIYTHGHPAVPYEDEDTLEHWYVSIRAFHDEEEECGGGCTEACERLIEDGSEVGYLRLWRLRDYTGADRWTVTDAESGDLESIASAVLDNGEYSTAFEEAIECPVGDLLILDRVFLSKPWRGFGLGPAFAAEAVRRLSGGCCAVAAEPGMAEWPENREEVTDAYRSEAKRKIAALWESIGFHTFQRGVQLLDTSLREPVDLLRQRRSDLEDLSAAYQAHLDGRPVTRPRPDPALPANPRTPEQAETRHQPDPWPETVAERGDGLSAGRSLSELEQRCASSGWSRSDRAISLKAAGRATSDTDLRELVAQVADVHFGLRDAWVGALTFPGRCFTVHPFRQDPAALGPLAGVWVYGSNLNGRYQGRSHAVGGDCRHSRPLAPDTERMTLAQLVELDRFWEWNGPGCAFCHGWSGQRLTRAQHAHYLSVVDALHS